MIFSITVFYLSKAIYENAELIVYFEQNKYWA